MENNKGRRRSQSVSRLIEGYHQCWEKGMSNDEIAQYYGVTTTTVYNNLEEIAQINGVARDEYLKNPQKPHGTHSQTKFASLKMTDDEISKLYEAYSDVITQTKTIQEEIDRILSENEDFINSI